MYRRGHSGRAPRLAAAGNWALHRFSIHVGEVDQKRSRGIQPTNLPAPEFRPTSPAVDHSSCEHHPVIPSWGHRSPALHSVSDPRSRSLFLCHATLERPGPLLYHGGSQSPQSTLGRSSLSVSLLHAAGDESRNTSVGGSGRARRRIVWRSLSLSLILRVQKGGRGSGRACAGMPRAAAAGRESKFRTEAEEEERAAGAAGADGRGDGDDVGGPLLPDRAASLVGPLLLSGSLD